MNPVSQSILKRGSKAFSLVEMLAAVAIIGVISFLAIPNLVRMRSDSEKNLAIARCEALNMAMATFIQVRGQAQAVAEWAAIGNATTDAAQQSRYALIDEYIAFSEANLADYRPAGYYIVFNPALNPLKKVQLRLGTSAANGTVIPY